MQLINTVLREMNFDYFGSGQHNVTGKDFLAHIKSEDALFLDVRTDDEQQFSVYPWAHHIPLHELPARLDELPEDKLIIPFCSSVFRASIAWTWLKAKGFARVKTLTMSTEEIATHIKPTPIFQQR